MAGDKRHAQCAPDIVGRRIHATPVPVLDNRVVVDPQRPAKLPLREQRAQIKSWHVRELGCLRGKVGMQPDIVVAQRPDTPCALGQLRDLGEPLLTGPQLCGRRMGPLTKDRRVSADTGPVHGVTVADHHLGLQLGQQLQ